MVERLAAALRRMDEHAQILARALLADELVESLRTKRGIRVLRSALGRGDSGGIGGHQLLVIASVAKQSRGGETLARMLDLIAQNLDPVELALLPHGEGRRREPGVLERRERDRDQPGEVGVGLR